MVLEEMSFLPNGTIAFTFKTQRGKKSWYDEASSQMDTVSCYISMTHQNWKRKGEKKSKSFNLKAASCLCNLDYTLSLQIHFSSKT